MTVVEALTNVMRDVSHVAKSDRNKHQGFDFRGIDAVINAVGPALREHGVVVLPQVLKCEYANVRTSQDKPATACRIEVRYAFHGPDGDPLVAEVVGEAWDTGDKSTPKAMSVAFRTALLQTLCLPTHAPDPDVDSYERAEEPVATTGRSDADHVRDQILLYAKEHKIPPSLIVEDFYARSKIDIREADAKFLRAYLNHLATHGGPDHPRSDTEEVNDESRD